jgi:hypothetical protein
LAITPIRELSTVPIALLTNESLATRRASAGYKQRGYDPSKHAAKVAPLFVQSEDGCVFLQTTHLLTVLKARLRRSQILGADDPKTLRVTTTNWHWIAWLADRERQQKALNNQALIAMTWSLWAPLDDSILASRKVRKSFWCFRTLTNP